jgi:hypothetical protein
MKNSVPNGDENQIICLDSESSDSHGRFIVLSTPASEKFQFESRTLMLCDAYKLDE